MSAPDGFECIRRALYIGALANHSGIKEADEALADLQAIAASCRTLVAGDFGFDKWGPEQERAAETIRASLDRLGVKGGAE